MRRFTVVHAPSVEDDVACAVGYYRKISSSLADTFLSQLREATRYLEQFPLAFAKRHGEVRAVSLRQFPHRIHFIVEEHQHLVVVISVMNTHRESAS
jgi:plasmid stabilization system protein ParE